MTIRSPDDAELDTLCEFLLERSTSLKTTDDWPAESLAACARAGVFRWFLTSEFGGDHHGLGWTPEQQTRGYLRLAAADLVTTFVITQYMGACRRIAASENAEVGRRWLESLMSGDKFGTVGISHLTTSRRHLSKPVLGCVKTPGGYRLDGMSPWVTGAPHADVVVTGATMDDGNQVLVAVSTDLPGVELSPGFDLVALSASCTDKVTFNNVTISDDMLIAGPDPDVMSGGSGATPGGLQTSTLAVGLATAAVQYLSGEAEKRDNLISAAESLTAELDKLRADLLIAVANSAGCDAAGIRQRANDMALRTTSAALMAAKGAGFVEGHRVAKWCREALFFLVWSCPQPVADAHLCGFAGLE